MRKVLGQGVLVAVALMVALAATGSGIAAAIASPSAAGPAGSPPVTSGSTTVTTRPGQPSLPTIALPLAPSAAAPTLTVTPSTGLISGQVVSVAGTGFTAAPLGSAAVAIVQCRAGAIGASDCSLNNISYPSVAADGSFAGTFTVHRTVNAGGTTVACDTAPGTCILGAATLSDQTQSASTPLAFDPNAPHPNPKLVVTPHDGLVNRDAVTVAGSGFLEGQFFSIAQCTVGADFCSYGGGSAGTGTTTSTTRAAASTGPADGGPTVAPDGTFTQTLTVTLRTRAVDGTPSTCIAVACEVRVSVYTDADYNTAAPIGFDPNQPIPPPPSLSVTPTTGLADRQLVHISGTNFDPRTNLSIRECLGGLDGCRYLNDAPFVGADGTVSADIAVRRLIRHFVNETDPPQLADCAVIACHLDISAYDVLNDSFTIPLAFDASLPLPPPPTITVDPSTNLPFRSTVTVTGHGFSPNGFVYAEQCVRSVASGSCFSNADGQADAAGDVTLSLPVQRRAVDFDGSLLDCTAVGVECVVQIFSQDDDQVSAPLAFDPNSTVPPPPIAHVSPDTGLGWKQPVHVTGSGFAPSDKVIVEECTPVTFGVAPNTFVSTQCSGANYIHPTTTDAGGGLDTMFTARRYITNGSSAPIDCSEFVGKCFVRVVAFDGFFGDAPADVALGFDANSQQPPGPPVTVTPTTGLADGDTVDVAGSGFSADASIGLAMCRAGTLSIDNCDVSNSQIHPADANGAVHANFVVHDVIQTNGGPVDCAAAPGTCVLGVANIGDYIEFNLTPLSFGPDVSVNDATVVEGTGANTPIPVSVHLSRPANRPVSVHWTTTDGTAIAGADYLGTEGDVVVPAGQTDAAIPVEVVGDALDERTERFTVTLSGANGGPLADATAKVTIRDDDRAPRLTMGDMTVTEGDSGTSVGVIPVWLSNPSAHDVVVTYRTHSRSARAGKDYVRTRGTITIPAGSTGAFITIPIIGDHRHERTESFRVEVTGATNSVIRDGTATETILDND